MDYFEDLAMVIRLNNGQYDMVKLEKAFQVAEQAHEGQTRQTGEPYIMHPIEVAKILADLGMDTETLVAALLHDVVEDTSITLEEITHQFGAETALLVDGMTKLKKIPFSSREEQQAENIRKMLMAMAQDIRVIIIKLADRLHNLRTIKVKKPEKQRETALETMEVYAPLAHRLGIRTIQEELEDLSLHYLDPIGYAEIEDLLNTEEVEREKFLNHIREEITQRLGDNYPGMIIDGRVKSIYGIYRKMFIQNRDFDEIYDIYAVRVIVGTLNECYNILGEVHDLFRPIPNRFKDYISVSKPNKYQSLHTTVVDESAIPFEVQIRTFEMHHTAEYGIAAHWKYKEGIKGGQDALDERISWVRQILEAQKSALDSQELIGTIKTDLATDEVYAFTPKGDVIALPLGSTVIDFAYAIHSEVGNSMTGAKIDGRMVSLDTEIETGNIVNVLTSNAPGHGPSRDWLDIVKTNSTKSKIRSWFRKERREENIVEGKAELEKELRRHRIRIPEDQREEFILRISKKQRLNTIEEMYAAIGYGGINLTNVMPKIKELYDKEYKAATLEDVQEQLEKNTAKEKKKTSSSVIVQGQDDFLVKFAKCCSPLPGDDIIGYVTRGFGVSVHKKDCINVAGTMSDPDQKDRWVDCEWAYIPKKEETFKSTIDILADDRNALLLDVSVALNAMRMPIYSLIAREVEDDITSIQITFGVSGLGQLEHAIKMLGKIDGIHSIERTLQ